MTAGLMSRSRYGASYHSNLEARFGIAIGVGLGVVLVLVLLKLLLPWLLLLGAIAWGYRSWDRQRQRRFALHCLFYELLKVNQGCVSALEFAMAAQIPGEEARAFLDARARDFFAEFEPTMQGDILYNFSLQRVPSTPPV